MNRVFHIIHRKAVHRNYAVDEACPAGTRMIQWEKWMVCFQVWIASAGRGSRPMGRKRMGRWELLLIDADNTLFDFGASQVIALERACLQVGIAYQPELLARYEHINAQVWAAYERKEITQEQLRRLRSERFLAELNSALDPETFGQAYVEALSNTAVVLPDALETLQAASAHAPVIILTNGIAQVQRRRMAASPFGPYIRGMAISGELGVAKPDPRIVRAAMEMGGATDPDRVLLVGDSLSADIAGAHAAGVASCWYNPKRLPCTLTPPPTYEIYELPALMRLL